MIWWWLGKLLWLFACLSWGWDLYALIDHGEQLSLVSQAVGLIFVLWYSLGKLLGVKDNDRW